MAKEELQKQTCSPLPVCQLKTETAHYLPLLSLTNSGYQLELSLPGISVKAVPWGHSYIYRVEARDAVDILCCTGQS